MSTNGSLPVPNTWPYRKDATYVVGPKRRHTMNDEVCYGPWMYVMFPASATTTDGRPLGPTFYCPKCKVGIGNSGSGKEMFVELDKARIKRVSK